MPFILTKVVLPPCCHLCWVTGSGQDAGKNAAEKNPEFCASKRARKKNAGVLCFLQVKRRAGEQCSSGGGDPGTKKNKKNGPKNVNLPAWIARTGEDEDEMILEPR